MSQKVKISGLEEFKAAMARKSKALQAGLPDAVKEAVNAGYKTASSKAPQRTGELKGSLEKKISGLEGEVQTDLRYAHFVEFGTKAHGGPQPFIRPAQKKANKVLIKKVLETVKKK